MASTYKTPGVYVEEISTLPASVAPVATAIPAFIGFTEKADRLGADVTGVPVRIKSMPEYAQYFGGPELETGISVTVTTTGENTTVTATDPTAPSRFHMYYSLKMYFDNGGGPCYICSVGDYDDSITSANLQTGLDAVALEDEPTLLVFPDAVSIATSIKTQFYDIYKQALVQCGKLKDRFTILDVYGNTGDIEADSLAFRNGIGTDNLKYGGAYYPRMKSSLPYQIDESSITVSHSDDNEESGTGAYDGVALSVLGAAEVDDEGSMVPNPDFNLALYNQVKLAIQGLTVTLPASPIMAGIYARVDQNRGVWKAPANVSLNTVIKPTIKISAEDQENMNVHETGKSINAIRAFTGKGIMAWGARTLAGNDNEWRYINVRRFYNFAEESIKKATEFVVFEPNDANTWVRTKAMIENFLTLQWRAGALAGATPEDAYFVNVGLGTTMTAQDILEGRMIIEIGMAVVRPAEFIILRFSHKIQES